jgi:glycolate oxidase FAD binding subunit
LSGDGNLVHGGGKVVKNAAGFDLPKFLVGSLGRYGIIVEASFKVFPQPIKLRTLRLPCSSPEEAMQRATAVACSRWEADAVDYRPGDQTLCIRLGGPEKATAEIADEILARWPGGSVLQENESETFWLSIREFTWPPFQEPLIVKVPTTVVSYLLLQKAMDACEGASLHVSVAGGVTWVALRDTASLEWLDDQLRRLNLAGLIVRGKIVSPKIGLWQESEMQQTIKRAIDPQDKFPGI